VRNDHTIEAGVRQREACRILLVDALGGLREAVSEVLTLPEFDLCATAEMAEAPRLAEAARANGQPFSLAVIDPQVSADFADTEAVSRLCEADPNLQIVVCADRMEPAWEEAAQAGRVEFVAKPFCTSHVRQIIRVLASRWTLERASERMKRELEAVREKAALLDKVPDAIFVLDLEGRILSWNPGAERLYGRAADQVIGDRGHPLLGGDARQLAEAKRVTLEAGAWAGEYRQRHADGRELTVESSWTLVRDADGPPKSLLVINTDITVKKQLELKSIRAQRLETIGTLTGGIAHDLNNVLQPISMAMDLFRAQMSDPKCQHVLNVVSRNTERAAELIRQVLSFARSVEGERLLVQPADIVAEIASVVRNTFPKAIDFRQTPVVEPWQILGDSTQLCQALLHLCMNARDAMPEGGTLTIAVKNIHIDAHFAALHADATPGDFVVIAVTDTGCGIPENLREKVFDPFFTTKEPGQGAGLGLTTTLTIVRSHGGFVTLNSKSDRGTTVRLFLPAVKSEPQPGVPRRRASDRRAALGSSERGDGELVLVVDDEPSVSTVMRLALERAGYRVLVAGNGAEGLRAYEQHRNDIKIILTDMVMPVMDGPGMIAAIKTFDPGARIVAMTGMSTKASVDAVRQLGVERVLSKPCTSRVILGALREVLEA
jgi:PAS domain S-box-containing protein